MLTMYAWMATEGGRKCPVCGRYARQEDITSERVRIRNQDGQAVGSFTLVGHRRGAGCRKDINEESNNET